MMLAWSETIQARSERIYLDFFELSAL